MEYYTDPAERRKMAQWVVETTDQYDRDQKYYSKKHSDELIAVLDNLDTYLMLLNACASPLQATAGSYTMSLTGSRP